MKDCKKKSKNLYTYGHLLKSRRKQTIIGCELRVNAITYSENNDICECWADNFKSIFETDRSPVREQNMKHIADLRNVFRAVSDDTTEFDYDKI